MSTPVHLPRVLFLEMLEHALADNPMECCGLLGGVMLHDGVGLIKQRYPLKNILGSAIAYAAEPRELFVCSKDMRTRGLELLATYHSHPISPPIPSPRDLNENYYPGITHFIISLQKKEPELRGWWLTAENYQEADWKVVDNEGNGGS